MDKNSRDVDHISCMYNARVEVKWNALEVVRGQEEGKANRIFRFRRRPLARLPRPVSADD